MGSMPVLTVVISEKEITQEFRTKNRVDGL